MDVPYFEQGWKVFKTILEQIPDAKRRFCVFTCFPESFSTAGFGKDSCKTCRTKWIFKTTISSVTKITV